MLDAQESTGAVGFSKLRFWLNEYVHVVCNLFCRHWCWLDAMLMLFILLYDYSLSFIALLAFYRLKSLSLCMDSQDHLSMHSSFGLLEEQRNLTGLTHLALDTKGQPYILGKSRYHVLSGWAYACYTRVKLSMLFLLSCHLAGQMLHVVCSKCHFHTKIVSWTALTSQTGATSGKDTDKARKICSWACWPSLQFPRNVASPIIAI